MNFPSDSPDLTDTVKPVSKIEDYVREHPVSTLLFAAGLGLAVVLVTRALTPPPPPKNRALQLLEDIQQRMASLARTGYDRVSSLAEDGANAVSQGVDSLGTLHLDRKIDKLSRRFKSLFQ